MNYTSNHQIGRTIQPIVRKSHFCLGTALLTMSLLLGCGGGSDETSEPASTDNATESESEANAGTDAPSDITLVQEGATTAPAQVVAVFLDSLRSGDESAANAVLTTKAREEIAKTSFEMQPIGTPQGQFTIGRVGFLNDNNTVALVESTWTEPQVANEPQTAIDIVCEVHQEVEGWRIGVIAISIPGTEETLVLDFENAAALEATLEAATGQGAAAASASQQTAGGNTNVPVQGVPAQTVSTQQSAYQQTPQSTLQQPNSAYPALPAGNVPQYPAQGTQGYNTPPTNTTPPINTTPTNTQQQQYPNSLRPAGGATTGNSQSQYPSLPPLRGQN